MVPTPQELSASRQGMEENEKSGDRVVISGMSGLFPDSHHVKDLADILYNKKNPVSSQSRWKYNHPEVAQHTGRVPHLELFDAQFFKVHYRLGHTMDSMARKILEQAYQAIYDAGVSPEHLSGKKVGVYIGTCFSESEKTCFYVAHTRTGFGIAGCNKSMFANRISYWLNAKGPSMSIDESCCSSIAALEQAYLALSRGDCEAAIVGGGNVCLHPQSSVHYGRIMSISLDGKTKSFDENAAGCAKSEAINVLFLQKAKDALRIYADVIHVKSQFTSLLKGVTGPRYGFNRNPADVATFLNNFYKEAGVPPQDVEYVEAFGSAVPEADKSELESLDAVFCKNRKNELLVGSVMSNIGYGEAASGISAVTKVLLGYHNGLLAANLNCDKPRRDVPALRDGRMRILTEHEHFQRTYAAVNGLAITGVNAHVLLHGHYKPKDLSRYKSNIPHLVTISARQDFSVQHVLENLKSHPIDPEELALLHNIHATRISGHLGRGFTILDTNEEQKTISLCSKADYFDDAQRPLWFVYSGMGSQWVGMGTQLMRIPIFAAAIERCRRVLEPKGVDVVQIITSTDKTTFDNILNSFVGIAAIQIGLTDVLRELGLEPDNIIGHSVGELGCAYADGCFTAEEMILAAYYRGLVSVQTPFIRGSMAAVGIGYQQVLKMCPPEIEVACHNGPDSCTISGPANVMREFVAELTSKQIFAKEVPCSNIAYHSRYIAEAGPELLKYLSEVIKSPKARSERWLSTSVPQDKWNEPRAKYSSAEYHTNNLLNSVLFEETSRLIPPNAVLVEVAPHGLLQAILKRSLPDSCRHVPLTRRGHVDNVQFLLEAIGKLYMEGYNPKVQALYPKIEFPVSTGTPFLSPLVEWAHHERWNLPLYESAHRKVTASCKFVYSTHDEENMYLKGNILRGKTTFPFAAALVAVWDTLAMTNGLPKKQMSVQFHDIKLHTQLFLQDQRQLRLFVSLHRGTGLFEIMDENSRVATGYITSGAVDEGPFTKEFSSTEEMAMKSKDIYQLLFKRGYDYSGEFQAIHSANKSMTEAQIYWRNNWVTLIDGMLQLNALKNSHNCVSEPTHIRKLIIDVERHLNSQNTPIADDSLMTAHVFETYKLIRCGGVAIEHIKARLLPSIDTKMNLLPLKFVPFFQEADSDILTALLVYVQIVAENQNKSSINILELSDNEDGASYVRELTETFSNIPNIEVQHKLIRRKKILEERTHFLTDVDILLVNNLSTDDKLCQTLYRVLCRDIFVVNIETSAQCASNKPSALYRVVSSHRIKDQRLELLRWRPTSTAAATSVFTLRSLLDITMLTSTLAVLPQRHKLVIITSYPPIDGLKDYVQKWRKERSHIQVVMINDQIADDENKSQLSNMDLVFNMLENGQWGGTYFVPLQQNVSVSSDISLQCPRVGDYNSLTWTEMPKISDNGVKVSVHYAGINNIDIKKCSGKITQDNNQNGFGMDFSGVTMSGARVMGLVSGGAASSCVLARQDLLWPVPGHWSLEEAATVPLAYCLAFYCLCVKYKLYPGVTVLVHGGAGALGQAVISVALGIGCKVFTTVSDVNKKRFLRKLFPELQDGHIGNSRDHTFGDMVLSRTNGLGCNLVLNCVSEELKNASLKATASEGTTIDLTQLNAGDNFYYGMFNLNKDRSYSIIDFEEAINRGSTQELKMLQLLVSEGITKGYVRPLSRVVYSPMEVSRAFRLVAASRHRGRALIQLQAECEKFYAPQPELRLHCNANSSHLILCNSDYLGLRIAEKLVTRGARNIYVHGLEPTAYVEFEIRALQNLGIQVKVYNAPLNSDNDVNTLINNSNNLGPIEGIYFVATDKQSSSGINVLQMLDLVTRKLCPHLRYFGIIGSNADIGLSTCIRRSQDKLPVTSVTIPPIRKMGSTYKASNGIISEIDAINSFEFALKTNEPVLLAYVRPKKYQSLIEEITRIIGIKLSDDIDETATLTNLNIESNKFQFVCNFLRDVYNISLPVEEIPNLSIEKIKQMEESTKTLKQECTKGLSTFFLRVDPDELLVTTEMVILPTLVNSSGMRDDEFDTKETYLCIIPGLEGLHERFHTLGERLKLPAIVLQPGLDRPDESVSDLAKRYAGVLMKKTELKRNFYLLGFESGALVALEMAAILEKRGLTGTVFCLGESPDKFHITLKKQLDEYDNDERLQIAMAKHMFNLMVGDNTEVLEKELSYAKTWPERIEACIRSILGKVSHSAQYARELITCAYGRIKQVQAYRPTPQALRSKLILINASDSAGSIENSLQSYSQQPITVYQLNSPLAHSAEDLRCSAIVNKHLDAELLQQFEKKNLCESYLLNADQFMTTDPSSYES